RYRARQSTPPRCKLSTHAGIRRLCRPSIRELTGNRGEDRIRSTLKWIIPLALGVAVLGCWEGVVRIENIPPYVLPAPSAIWTAFVENFTSLMASLWTTLQITIEAFV